MELPSLLELMVEQGAFVLYLTAARPPMVRIDGELRSTCDDVLKPEELEALARSLMNQNQIAEFEERKMMNLVTFLPRACRFRVHIFRQRGSVGIVIQRVKHEIPSLDSLYLPPIYKDLSLSKEGLILIVGSAGSGKSTTLAAMIDHRNEHGSGHIVSIEDPIEFTHCHKNCIVTQRELGCDTKTFDQALSDCLQQAPDAVAIGAIGDAETMGSTISVAETGRLCIATFQAANVTQTLERILTLFPAARHPEILLRLALNLQAIAAQRLFFISDGSRVVAVEILISCTEITNLIEKGEFNALQDAIEKGCQTFDDSLLSLYEHGKITGDDALAHADSATKLRQKLNLVEPTINSNPAKPEDKIKHEKNAKFRIKGLELT